MDIVIDFDGTCVSHEYPDIGHDIGAAPVLRLLVKAGHRLILSTMRSDMTSDISEQEPSVLHVPKDFLTQAVNWFKQNDIPLFGIQTNPEQSSWTSSPKPYGQLYIDDAALGIPLCFNHYISSRPYVDWIQVSKLLKIENII